MKRFLSALLTVMVVGVASAQPSPSYNNNGQIVTNIPPNIDAYNFTNSGLFEISVGTFTVTAGTVNLATGTSVLRPYDFSDVTNYVNKGTMTSDAGFTFDNAPSTNGFRYAAQTFNNQNTGLISAGTLTNSVYAALLFYYSSSVNTAPQVNVLANVITNTGTILGGITSTLNLSGNVLNLSRGTLHVEGVSDFASSDYFGSLLSTNGQVSTSFGPSIAGVTVNLYGIGKETNAIRIGNVTLPTIYSPTITVANINGGNVSESIVIPNAKPFVFTKVVNPSNYTYQAVYINTNVAGFTSDVRFLTNAGDFNIPIIQYQSIATNINGVLVTNQFYIRDDYGANETNYLVTNGSTFGQIPIPAPFNYSFSRVYNGYTNLLTQNLPIYDLSIFANAFPATNVYAFEEINLSANSYLPDATLVFSSVTNVPGRIYINATNYLDLTRSRITGGNYINLLATNHFAGSALAQISVPDMDINVATTNGNLAISNLVGSYIALPTGIIDMYSARWTNVNTAGITNTFHILIVQDALSVNSPVSVLHFAARSTNITVSDSLNIGQTVVFTAKNITVTTNNPSAIPPFGVLNLQNPSTVWATSFPTLQNFTNYGAVYAANTTYFVNSTNDPAYNNNFSPYLSFVNDGQISTSGNIIWANYFENVGPGTNQYFSTISSNSLNAGLLSSTIGPISIQASNAVVLGGALFAPSGDITVASGSLAISNTEIYASGALTFYLTNTLADGSFASSNVWSVYNGMNLFTKPAAGDFLGSTAYLTAPANLEVQNIWAGLDRSNSATGFVNNGAFGHLVLNGTDINSQFYFGGPDQVTNYAIYVDLLDLQNTATNRVSDQYGNVSFAAFDIAPNFKIYFADAVIGANDISEKLNGANGGQLIWVPTYAGIFSSTNITYPSGLTYQFNRALRNSPDIDSNGQTPNSSTIYPFNVALSIARTNRPAATSLLSWYAPASSTNYVYFTTNLVNTNWQVLTNFVQGSGAARVTFADAARTNSQSFYKIRINPAF